MRQVFLSIFIVVWLSVTSLVGQKLSAEEQKIVDYIDKNNDHAISLLERAVNIDSPTEDLVGVKNVGMLFARELESLGMTVKWAPMPEDTKRAGHLVAD